jgi:hypothetical protein
MSRIVYGATCSWWNSIDKAGRTAGGLPGCPICHGPLYEMGTGEWWAGVDHKVKVDDPVYREFIEWLRGRCYRGPDYYVNGRVAFDAERALAEIRRRDIAEQTFDTGQPGLSPYRQIDISNARQLTGHLVESSAIHSQSRGWIPTIFVTLDHVPLVAGKGKTGRERLKVALELDVAQEFVDILITGIERAIADSEYGLREA